jgi:hypothetical protein
MPKYGKGREKEVTGRPTNDLTLGLLLVDGSRLHLEDQGVKGQLVQDYEISFSSKCVGFTGLCDGMAFSRRTCFHGVN